MNNILQFPSQSVKDWALMERGILQITREAGVNDEIATIILEKIKPLFKILSEDVSFTIVSNDPSPPYIENDALSAFLKKQSERILLERINREIEVLGQIGIL